MRISRQWGARSPSTPSPRRDDPVDTANLFPSERGARTTTLARATPERQRRLEEGFTNRKQGERSCRAPGPASRFAPGQGPVRGHQRGTQPVDRESAVFVDSKHRRTPARKAFHSASVKRSTGPSGFLESRTQISAPTNATSTQAKSHNHYCVARPAICRQVRTGARTKFAPFSHHMEARATTEPSRARPLRTRTRIRGG
jgi:hypothetical protein